MDEGGGGNPLIAEREDTTTWATGLWLVEDIQQAAGGISSGSWVDASIGAATVGLDTLGVVIDPLGSLVSMGVGWLMEHVQPLSDALDWLAGDPDQITAYAQTWGNIATHTGDAATDLTDAVQREAAPWTGLAAGAYRTHAGDQVTALDGIAKAAAGIGEAVQGAAELVATVRAIVRDLIAECVATLVARLPQWLAMEGFTLGLATPAVVSQVTALVSRWVARITRFLDGLIRSIGNLIPLLRRLGDLIGELKALLARLARTDPTAPRMTDEGTPGTGPPRDQDPDGGTDSSQADGDGAGSPATSDDIRGDLDDLPAGRQSHVRTVESEAELRDLYDGWSEGGTDVTPNSYDGTMVELPDGTIVGWRNSSRSGGSTIDIKLPDGTRLKVHIDGS